MKFRTIARSVASLALLLAVTGFGAIPRAKVVLGDEVFLRSTWHDLHGRCVGVVTNQTGVTSQLVNIVDAIRENPHICIKAIYSPEHGLRGDQLAGHFVSSYRDPRTGLPVYSLYGPQRMPTAAMLRGVDVLLFDIQDVGDRAYTYISTMAEVMRAAARYHKSVWVLDRPNPIGGETVEGPVLDPHFRSFIGLYPIAMRHGMTIGELAEMFNNAFGIHAHLRVVKMIGWRRSMLWSQTGLRWVESSPNIPTWQTTLVYPCTGLIDNGGINNGVGTAKPFFYAGYLGMPAYAYASALNAEHLPGVYFRPAAWSPFFGFWRGRELSGVELYVTHPHRFRSVETAVELLVAGHRLMPHLRINARGMDDDWGTDAVRIGLERGESARQIIDSWQPALARFMKLRAKYLLYPN